MKKPATVEELLLPAGAQHVWILSYGISMGRNMRLAIHDGEFVDRIEILAKGCSYWRGPLEGGPWHLVLERLDQGEGSRVRFADRDGGFELICDSLQLAEQARIPIG